MTNNQQVTSKQAEIESYIKQGFDRATAIRVANAKPAKVETSSRGNLSSNKGFSLLR